MDLTFGDVELVINEGWRPRARLCDVRLTEAQGDVIVQLTDARASPAMRPLLQGRMQPKSIALSGGSVTIRREAAGGFSLMLENEIAAVERAENATALWPPWPMC